MFCSNVLKKEKWCLTKGIVDRIELICFGRARGNELLEDILQKSSLTCYLQASSSLSVRTRKSLA